MEWYQKDPVSMSLSHIRSIHFFNSIKSSQVYSFTWFILFWFWYKTIYLFFYCAWLNILWNLTLCLFLIACYNYHAHAWLRSIWCLLIYHLSCLNDFLMFSMLNSQRLWHIILTFIMWFKCQNSVEILAS